MKIGNEQPTPSAEVYQAGSTLASLTAMVDGVELQVKEARAFSPEAYQGY
jgi:hypothetical protein